MKRDIGFDEVMIVNPFPPRHEKEGVRLMRFHHAQPPQMGYYAQPYEGYGYYGEDPYAEAEPYGYYAEPEPYGYYGYAAPAGYGQADPYGAYGYAGYAPMGEYEPMGEFDPMGEYGEDPYGEYEEYGPMGETDPFGAYGVMPEMVGYGEHEPLAEGYPGYGHYHGYGEPEFGGYVRDVPPTFNAGCPLPTNVAGFGEYEYGESEPFAGYVKPGEVSPRCDTFTPQPGPTPSVPETFRPLW
jgi:hypothetical protein